MNFNVRKALINREIMVGYDLMRPSMPERNAGEIPPGLDLEWTLFNALLTTVSPEVKRRQ